MPREFLLHLVSSLSATVGADWPGKAKTLFTGAAGQQRRVGRDVFEEGNPQRGEIRTRFFFNGDCLC